MRLDPELLPPPPRPRCPKCKMRMVAGNASPGPEGFERQAFECLKCGHQQAVMVPCDPIKSDALGWLSGELGHSATEHVIRNGRLVPKKSRTT
jgi:hypothetical protein